MPKIVVAYTDPDHCPVCDELLPRLKLMEIDGKIDLIVVDVRKIKGGRLMERYEHICNNAFGGRAEVPAIMMEGEKDYYIPTVTTGPGGRTKGEDPIEQAVEKVVEMIEEDVDKPAPAYHPTHRHALEFGGR